VVNCAGAGLRGRAADLDFEGQRGVIAVNVTALVYLSKLALEQFEKAGRGTLVNVSSSAAFQPLPGMAVYAASKSFVLQFTEALWAEMRPSPGIRILVVCPSGTATRFQSSAGVRALSGEKLLSPEEVAAGIRAWAERDPCTAIIGTRGKYMALLSRLLPRKQAALLWRRLMEQGR
jgi:hypothetical protein